MIRSTLGAVSLLALFAMPHGASAQDVERDTEIYLHQSVSGLIGFMYSPDRLRQRLQSITRSTCLVNSI